MRPLTFHTPKQLLEVGGKPILVHIFENLPDEINEVILVVGYLGHKIREYFGDEFLGRKIAYVEQPAKLGTGRRFVALPRVFRGREISHALRRRHY